MHTLLRNRRSFFGIALAAVALAACDSGPTTPSDPKPTAVIVLSGDAQVAAPATPLDEPLSVKVVDLEGFPFAGAVVTWAVTEGGGTLDAATTTTDESGVAQVNFTLGPVAGPNTVTATLPGVETVQFTATAEPATSPRP